MSGKKLGKMLGKDIQPGDLLEGYGLVLEVHHLPDKFWHGPHMKYIGEDGPHSNSCSCALDPNQEYNILNNLGSIEYERFVRDTITELQTDAIEMLQEAQTLVTFLR